MAASGRVPPSVLDMMSSTVQVASPSSTSRYGEDSHGVTRDVGCMVQPVSTTVRNLDGEQVTVRYMIYANDVDIAAEDIVTTAAGYTGKVEKIETYHDEVGAMYQVVAIS